MESITKMIKKIILLLKTKNLLKTNNLLITDTIFKELDPEILLSTPLISSKL